MELGFQTEAEEGHHSARRSEAAPSYRWSPAILKPMSRSQRGLCIQRQRPKEYPPGAAKVWVCAAHSWLAEAASESLHIIIRLVEKTYRATRRV
jgi:hypothetical protein